MELAIAASLRSEDPYVQVGSCILREDMSVASVGYNGAPSGIEIDWVEPSPAAKLPSKLGS